MTRMTLAAALLMVALTLTGGCRRPAARAPVRTPKIGWRPDPGRVQALARQFREIMHMAERGEDEQVTEALAELALPDPQTWFVATFGEERGGEYAAKYPKDPQVVAKRLTQELQIPLCLRYGYGVSARRGDPSGERDRLVAEMVVPTDLYSVTLTLTPEEEMQRAGMAVMYFVETDHGFGFIGQPGWDPDQPGKIDSWRREYDW